jgi:hypothetical protein
LRILIWIRSLFVIYGLLGLIVDIFLLEKNLLELKKFLIDKMASKAQVVPRKNLKKTQPIATPSVDPLLERAKILPTTNLVKAKQEEKVNPESDEEIISFESVIRDTPEPKIVAKFLQGCVNQICKNDDSDLESTDMNDSEY